MKIFFGIIKYSALTVFLGILTATVATYLKLPIPTRPLVVQTGSMAPAIPAGSLVATYSRANDGAGVSYVENDVITFKKGNELVSHRVVNIIRENGKKYFQTKGDANNENDPQLVSEKDVVGKVVFAAPFVGKLVSFVKQPIGFLFLVVVPTLFIIISEFVVIAGEVRKKPKKKSDPINIYKPITLTVLCFLFIGSSFSYFSDVATSTDNTFETSNNFANLKINEFVANPGTAFANEWVEIYNAGTVAVDLTGWTLIDAAPSVRSLTPLGTINPGEFKILEIAEGWLNNSAGGDSVTLRDSSTAVIDTTSYTTAQADDIARGRQFDGTGTFQTCATATKGTSNNGNC